MTSSVTDPNPMPSADAWLTIQQSVAGLNRTWAPWIPAGVELQTLVDVIRPLTEAAACSRLQQAERLADAGFRHVILTRPIVDPEHLAQRLPQLLSRIRLTITVDHFRHAELLSPVARATGRRIGLLLDADAGACETGLRPGPDTSRLAQAISAIPGLIPEGIHVDDSAVSSRDSGESFLKCLTIAREAQRSVERCRIDCPSIVTGRTCPPELFRPHSDVGILLCAPSGPATDPGMSEPLQRKGDQHSHPSAPPACTQIVARVLSRPSLERCVLDAGRDQLNRASDWTVSNPRGARILQIRDDVTILLLSDASLDLTIGQHVTLVDKSAPQ